MWAVFSLHVRGNHAIFSVCGGGGDLFFCMGGGIIGLAHNPHNNFCGSLLSQKSFQIVEVLIFFEGAIRSTQKTSPPPHSQYFSFSHYYHYPITPPPPRSCMLPEKQSKWAKKSTNLS